MLETLIVSLLALDLSLIFFTLNRLSRKPPMAEQQEENNHNYQELQKGWEFKILRTNNDGFRKTSVLKQVCAEELDSGWILLEKLDDSRLRFRRPIKLRERDHLAKIDPYRSFYGQNSLGHILVGALLLGLMAIPTFLGFMFMQNIFKSLPTPNLSAPSNK